MTRRERVAMSILSPINPSIIIILGAYTIVWGLWIASPFWTVFTQAPLYNAMAGVAAETFWGPMAILAGAFIVRGATKPNYRNLQLGAFIGFIHWLIISILYFIGDWTSTGGITSLAFAVYSAVVWLNIKVNRSHYD